VYGADRLKRPERIIEWMERRKDNPLTFVVFVSGEESLAREEQTAEQRKEKKQAALVPHLLAIQGKGHLIECKPFTNNTAKHAVTWVCSKVDIRRGVAGKLLERANGDLRLTRDAFRKLSVFPEEITEQTINLLLSARPRMSFVDALLDIDKSAALLALDYMEESEYSAAIGLLDQRLEVLGTVRDLLMAHATRAQVSAALGTQGFLAQDLIPLAKSYDRRRRQECRALLERTDSALKSGIGRDAMVVLVLFW
jgi:DNA polymerase III delta subunit